MSMDVPLFPAGTDVEERRQLTSLACGAVGPFGAWQPWYTAAHPACQNRHPLCNRALSHDGSHRTYDTKARIRAEW